MFGRLCVFLQPWFVLSTTTITGHIFCDNYFEFYFNGQLIKKDPLDFTPHQAVKVSFTWDGTSDKTYAILCQDYASDSGYEYTSTNSPKLGDGNLLAEFSDGTKTSKDWKVYVVTHGPTDASVQAGCSATNLDACVVQDNGSPSNWHDCSFDDSQWSAATEYTVAQGGWGRGPTYSSGKCGTITSPLTKQNANPSSIETEEDECLNPKTVLCGGDQDCTGDDGRMIWGASLEKDNKVLFRYTVKGSGCASTGNPSAAATTVAAASGGDTTAGETTSASGSTTIATTTGAPDTIAAASSALRGGLSIFVQLCLLLLFMN